MRKALRRLIPSMFHRRLLLLAVCGALLLGVMATQATRLTLGSVQAQRLAQAEQALRTTDLIPTVRGEILDRNGKVLATDEPGWAIAVNYSVIAGEWAYGKAEHKAYVDNRDRWSELSPSDRAALIDTYQRPYDEQVQMLWSILAELDGVPRAEIEQRKATITRRVQRTTWHLWEHWREARAQELGEAVDLSTVARPIAEQQQAHAILTDVSDQTRKQVQGFIAEAERPTEEADALAVWQQVSLERPKERRYPRETMTVAVDRSYLPSPLRHEDRLDVTVKGVGLHILGQMRDVWAKDDRRRPFNIHGDLGGYLAGDRVGSFGIEASQEDRLRGTRGKVTRQLDSGKEIRTEPTPGQDVKLAINVDLQAYVQALMSPEIGLMRLQKWQGHADQHPDRIGEPLNGAAVVVDIQTNDIIAAVSVPSMPLDTLRNDPDAIYQDAANMPSLNRVIGRVYQPGSIVKPLILNAAVTEGLLHRGELVNCPGYLWPGKNKVFRDWLYKAVQVPFGNLDGTDALMVSSNVFFGKMFQRLGAERAVRWYHRFGVDRALDCGLEGSVPGRLPDPKTDRMGDMTFIAIGQGPIAWTPLHAAAAYAAFARGGVFQTPSFIRTPRDARPNDARELNLSPVGVEMAFEGMTKSANDTTGGAMHEGTTSELHELDEPIFNAPGVRVMAKSGTAQAAPLRRPIDDDGDGYPDRYGEILKHGDHAWVVALVQPEGAPNPTHVIVVLVEYGGSGGQVAGPVVNAIIHAMQDLGVQGFGQPATPNNPPSPSTAWSQSPGQPAAPIGGDA